MIRNRNIAQDAGISPSKILGGGLIGAGEIYYVYNSADDATVGEWLRQRVDSDHVFNATAASSDTAIQAALNACVANRNDYVIIMPSGTTYSTTAALTMSKKAVHLVCPAGMGLEIGATNAARIMQTTANTKLLDISAAACEVAGLYLKHSNCATASLANGSAINMSSGGYCANIHHNYFAINGSGSTNSPIVCFDGANTAWGWLHHNKFLHLTDSTTWASIVLVHIANNTEISHNSYNATCGAGVTVTSVFNFGTAALYGECSYNDFYSGAANASYGIVASTITQCIYLAESAMAIGNRGAVPSGTLLANYGTITGRSFCDNIDGRTTTTGDGGQVYNLES